MRRRTRKHVPFCCLLLALPGAGAGECLAQEQASAPVQADAVDESALSLVEAYNVGRVRADSGDAAGAERLFRRVERESDDPTLASRARFNLGALAYREATTLADTDRGRAIESLKRSERWFRRAHGGSPELRTAAARNVESVQRLLRQLQDQAQPAEPQQQDQQNTPPQDESQQAEQRQDQQQSADSASGEDGPQEQQEQSTSQSPEGSEAGQTSQEQQEEQQGQQREQSGSDGQSQAQPPQSGSEAREQDGSGEQADSAPPAGAADQQEPASGARAAGEQEAQHPPEPQPQEEPATPQPGDAADAQQPASEKAEPRLGPEGLSKEATPSSPTAPESVDEGASGRPAPAGVAAGEDGRPLDPEEARRRAMVARILDKERREQEAIRRAIREALRRRGLAPVRDW